MTVRDLIELLQEFDPNLDVKVTSGTGGHCFVNSVDQETEHSPYDQDFDRQVVVIR